jgi:hypothetical protein
MLRSSTGSNPSYMRWLAALVVVIVIVLHQDVWLWTDRTLVGFLPIGLAYHVGYTVLASLTMWLLVRLAWPKELETTDAESAPGGSAA